MGKKGDNLFPIDQNLRRFISTANPIENSVAVGPAILGISFVSVQASDRKFVLSRPLKGQPRSLTLRPLLIRHACRLSGHAFHDTDPLCPGTNL